MSLTSLKNYFLHDLWYSNEDSSRKELLFKRFLRVVYIAIREFIENELSNRAAALTYSTLLSIVPILAICFAISRGFGFNELMEHQIYQTFSGQKNVADHLLDFVNSYLMNAKGGVFIGVGLVMLLYTVINLTSDIEMTFNDIWNIKKSRTLYRRLTDYFSIFLLLPIFIVLSGGLSIFVAQVAKQMDSFLLLGGMMKFLICLVPFALSWLVFTGLFIFMPNTRVRFVPALIAGIVAGSGYQAFQYIYINGQVGISKYNAIYGSFAALPLFLLWLQISWTIILFGVEINYALQNARNLNYSEDAKQITSRYRDFTIIIIMALICKRFHRGEKPYTSNGISSESRIPIRLVQSTLNLLQEIGLVHEMDNEKEYGEAYYLPSVDVHSLSVGVLLNRIYTHGSENIEFNREKYIPEWDALLRCRKDISVEEDKLLIDL